MFLGASHQKNMGWGASGWIAVSKTKTLPQGALILQGEEDRCSNQYKIQVAGCPKRGGKSYRRWNEREIPSHQERLRGGPSQLGEWWPCNQWDIQVQALAGSRDVSQKSGRAGCVWEVQSPKPRLKEFVLSSPTPVWNSWDAFAAAASRPQVQLGLLISPQRDFLLQLRSRTSA